VMLYHSDVLYEDTRNSVSGWNGYIEGSYYHPVKSLGVQAGYYRNMKKNVLWQGFQYSDKDYWCITVRKELWQKRLSVAMSYIPPIAFGVRYNQIKTVDTPLYKETTTLNLQSYNQMLLLKISFRLERGSSKRTETDTYNRNNERER